MGTITRYWSLVRIDSSGRNKVEVLLPARTFFQQNFSHLLEDQRVPDGLVQNQLLSLIQDHSESRHSNIGTQAELCLRCFVSNIIEQVCVQLEAQFGTPHGFTRFDLFPFVLNESSQLRRSRCDSGTLYQSLTDEILQTFDPAQGSLTTWTARLVRRHRELNAFLLECGVYLISDWAILNDTTLQQVQRILSEFHGLTTIEVRCAHQLLESYHAIYRRDRLRQRQRGLKGHCLEPTGEQLCQIAQRYTDSSLSLEVPTAISPTTVLSQLQTLAEYLRQYRIYVRGGPAPTASLEELNESSGAASQLITTTNDQSNEDEQSEFLTFYREQFPLSLEQAIAAVIQGQVVRLKQNNSLQASQFLQALYLFHCCGKSMGDIAPQVGLRAQYQVTRLLKLKDLRAEVRRRLILEIRDRVLAEAKTYADPTQLQVLDRQIEAAIEEQVAEVIQEVAAEASIARNRPTRSLFARQLCHHLDTRSLEP